MKTIAHEALDIEKKIFKVRKSSYDKLEFIIDRVDEELDKRENPKSILSTIKRVLDLQGYSNSDTELFSKALLERSLSAIDLAFVYAAVGDALKLPIKIVRAPNHTFVRFDNGERINWEPVTGESQVDDVYRESHLIHPASVDQGVYLKSLSRNEMLGLVYNMRGYGRIKSGDWEGGMNDVSNALVLNPRDPTIRFNRSSMYANEGIYDSAVEDLSEVLKLDPNFEDAYRLRSVANFNNENHEHALKDIRQAIALNGKNPENHFTHGMFLINKGKKFDAVNALSLSIGFGNQDLDVFILRGRLLADMGEYEQAVSDFDQVLAVIPHDDGIRYERKQANMMHVRRN